MFHKNGLLVLAVVVPVVCNKKGLKEKGEKLKSFINIRNEFG